MLLLVLRLAGMNQYALIFKHDKMNSPAKGLKGVVLYEVLSVGGIQQTIVS